jgi:hypothetical protein
MTLVAHALRRAGRLAQAACVRLATQAQSRLGPKKAQTFGETMAGKSRAGLANERTAVRAGTRKDTTENEAEAIRSELQRENDELARLGLTVAHLQLGHSRGKAERMAADLDLAGVEPRQRMELTAVGQVIRAFVERGLDLEEAVRVALDEPKKEKSRIASGKKKKKQNLRGR